MNRIRRLLLPALLACGVALPLQAAPPADLDARVARAMQTFGPPGLALAIVEDGNTVVARGYGQREMQKQAPVDAHTLFPIGSCTKAFVAASLALLVDEGKLGWDDKVIEHMPWFRMYDPYVTAEITVRDLLVHRSGLGLGAGDLLWLGGSDYSRRELVERLRHIKPATSFRSGFAYDNVLYVAAGQLVEEVSGQSWEKFTAQKILKPLSMKDTVVPFADVARVRNRVALHARTSEALRGLGPQAVLSDASSALASPNVAPAGSIYSSASDMASWMKVQLAQGALPGGKRLYSEKQSREMWTGVVPLPTEPGPAVLAAQDPQFSLYALGWGVEDYRGHRVITHTGGVFGGVAVVMLVPEKKLGISVLINSEDGAVRGALVNGLLDHYLGLPTQDWTGDYRKALDEVYAKAQAQLAQLPAAPQGGQGAGPSLSLEKYAGTYEDAWYGKVFVRHQAGGLRIQFAHTPRLGGPLEHVHHDTFRTRFADRTYEDTYLSFALKPDGSIEQVKLRAVSPLADFSFNYQDLLLLPVAAP